MPYTIALVPQNLLVRTTQHHNLSQSLRPGPSHGSGLRIGAQVSLLAAHVLLSHPGLFASTCKEGTKGEVSAAVDFEVPKRLYTA